ncbi:hypothetical protein DL96DRAFT_1821395 [Flagelloscypha sp. PMI_526]|nr:hypothetical protein DL96DRAFT_1821395 [Flagelloscypha sp. PMI_526]
MSQSLALVTTTVASGAPTVLSNTDTPSRVTGPRNKSVSIGFPTASPIPDPPNSSLASPSPTVSIGFPTMGPLDDPSRQGGPRNDNPGDAGESSSSSDSSNSNPNVESGTLLQQPTSLAFASSSSPTLSALLGLQTPPTTSTFDTSMPGQGEASSSSSGSNGSRPRRQVSTMVLGAVVGTLLLHMAVD